jgi:anti-sigma factor (TIGR02949 family)
MMNCRETLKRFYEYLDRELPEVEAREVAEHLERCRTCFDRAEFERHFGGFLRRAGETRVEAGAIKERIKARIRELGSDVGPPAEELFPQHQDHAPIDDVPLPEPHPLAASQVSRRRIPIWSYIVAAAAVVLGTVPLLRRSTPPKTPDAALVRLAAFHGAHQPQVLASDPAFLTEWLRERLAFGPTVPDLASVGCTVEGVSVDSIWAHLFTRSGGTPVSVFVAAMLDFRIPAGLEVVREGNYVFRTGTVDDVAVVIWQGHPEGVVCAAVARTDVRELVSLARRLEDLMQKAPG